MKIKYKHLFRLAILVAFFHLIKLWIGFESTMIILACGIAVDTMKIIEDKK